MRVNRIALPALTGAAILGTGCSKPDVVVRKDSGFSRASTLTLTTTAVADPVNLIPELEKELIRQGFNIIARDVSSVETQTTSEMANKAGEKAEETKNTTQNAAAAIGASIGTSSTTSSTHRLFKSEFVGRVDYLYNSHKMTASRVNLTILNLASGTVVASVSFDSGGNNREISTNIANQLSQAIR